MNVVAVFENMDALASELADGRRVDLEAFREEVMSAVGTYVAGKAPRSGRLDQARAASTAALAAAQNLLNAMEEALEAHARLFHGDVYIDPPPGTFAGDLRKSVPVVRSIEAMLDRHAEMLRPASGRPRDNCWITANDHMGRAFHIATGCRPTRRAISAR